MGMFDDLTCEYPLPLPETQKLSFQTKNLDCDMDQYVITAGGRLMKKVFDYEEVPASERDAAGFPVWRIKEGSERQEDTAYHGFLNFYDYEPKDCPDLKWIEYRAKFTDGKLVDVKVVIAEKRESSGGEDAGDADGQE